MQDIELLRFGMQNIEILFITKLSLSPFVNQKSFLLSGHSGLFRQPYCNTN